MAKAKGKKAFEQVFTAINAIIHNPSLGISPKETCLSLKVHLLTSSEKILTSKRYITKNGAIYFLQQTKPAF
jgi:hypothetical protein